MALGNKALVASWYVEDNWYGKRYRAILTVSDDQGFITVGSAKKHSKAFKQLIKSNHNLSVTNKDITVNVKDELLTYEYISSGPSISYTHYDYNISDLPTG
jgi:hypothetical protein